MIYLLIVKGFLQTFNQHTYHLTELPLSSFLSLIRFYFFSVRILNIYSFSKFQLYNTELLTIFIMICIRSSELIHHIPEGCTFFPSSPHFSQHISLGNHQSTLCFYDFDFLKIYIFHIKVKHVIFVFLSLPYFIICYPSWSMSQMQNFLPFLRLNHILPYYISNFKTTYKVAVFKILWCVCNVCCSVMSSFLQPHGL